ncbi:MAG: energy transducer TonB [Saprospiraceae bacterium]|nr:energy transducer TonB [Candidatus Opimibacter iunctus]
MKFSPVYTLFLALLLSSAGNHISAQTPLDEAVRRADISPAWPGCEPKLTECTKSRMADFIAANLQMPTDAKAQGAGGVVMVEFVIEKNGTVGEVHPIHDPGLGLGAEATRVISLMKTKKIKWTPAEEEGKKVAFRYTVPVSFNLNTPESDKPKAAPAVQDVSGQIFDAAEVMPRYAGCEQAVKDSFDCTFMKVVSHIKSTLKYPEEALKNKVQGQVLAEFVVDTNGAIINPSIKKGIGSGCDEEALRVLTLMPAWIPGTQDGKPVKVRMKLPILFQLPKE